MKHQENKLEEEQSTLKDAQDKFKSTQTKKELLIEASTSLDKCTISIDDVGSEAKKKEAEEGEIKTVRASIAKAGEALNEAESQEQLLNREAELIQERVNRLDQQKLKRHTEAEKSVEIAKGELSELEKDKKEANLKLTEGEAFVSAMKGKMGELQGKHDKVMSETNEQLTMLADELSGFHGKLISSMGQTA